MIKPTVGRVVHFHPGEGDPLYVHNYTEPRAAIVTRVWSDRLVNLTVFDDGGNPHPRTSMPLAQPEDEKPGHSHCEWMPFQVGQSQAVKEAQASVPAG